jgi:DNA processing protein
MPRAASAAPAQAGAPAAKDPLLDALGFDPISLDELIARTGQGAAELSARLLDFELQGRVARLPGQRFQRVERG